MVRGPGGVGECGGVEVERKGSRADRSQEDGEEEAHRECEFGGLDGVYLVSAIREGAEDVGHGKARLSSSHSLVSGFHSRLVTDTPNSSSGTTFFALLHSPPSYLTEKLFHVRPHPRLLKHINPRRNPLLMYAVAVIGDMLRGPS